MQLVQLALKGRRVKPDHKAQQVLLVLLVLLAQQVLMVVTVLPQLLLLERFQLGLPVQAQR